MRKRSSSTTNAASTGDEDPNEATKWMYCVMISFGLEVEWTTKGAAYKAIHALQAGKTVEYAAGHLVGCQWKKVGASEKQLWLIDKLVTREGLPEWAAKKATNRRNAGLLLDAWLAPVKFVKERLKELDKADTAAKLDAVGRDIGLVNGVLPAEHFRQLVEAGQEKRELVGTDDVPE